MKSNTLKHKSAHSLKMKLSLCLCQSGIICSSVSGDKTVSTVIIPAQSCTQFMFLMLILSNLNFTGKLCVKLLRVPGHVGGLFTCRHKYDINARGVTRRVTRDSVTPAPRDVVTFSLSKQDSLQSVLWGREYICVHQSWCEIFCWLLSLINISRAEIIPLFIIDIPRYPLISLARESRYNLESHHASPHWIM